MERSFAQIEMGFVFFNKVKSNEYRWSYKTSTLLYSVKF